MSDETWRTAEESWERLAWARKHAGHLKKADAARALNVEPATYRTYERPTESNGRGLNGTFATAAARLFKVRWEWLLQGQGEPWLKPGASLDFSPMIAALEPLAPDERQEAIKAAANMVSAISAVRRSRS